jgi:hypothetical protein
MKPKLKLNKEQFDAFYHFFEYEVITDTPGDIAESLVMDLLKKIFLKMQKRRLQQCSKNGWSVSLEPFEAKGFYVYFNQRSLKDGFVYEKNIIRMHLSEFDQLYA